MSYKCLPLITKYEPKTCSIKKKIYRRIDKFRLINRNLKIMKRIVVLGAGESGAGAAVLAKVKGFDTFVSDMSAIKDKYKTLLDGHGTFKSFPVRGIYKFIIFPFIR